MTKQFVKVDTFVTLEEAYLALGLIESCGISGIIPDEAIAGNAWHLTHAIGGVRLLVPQEDAAEAIVILDAKHRRENLLDHPENVDTEWLEGTAISRRALDAALYGLMTIFPLPSLYSTWIILRGICSPAKQRFTGKAALRMGLAMLINSTIIGIWLWLFVLIAW